MSLLRHHSRHHLRRQFLPAQIRTFIDARVPWVRDRALDHAVEKEKHLVPFLNVKDLLLSPTNPSPSVPLSAISPHASSLLLPFRPIRFLRLFPSSFLQSFPDPQNPNLPHFQPSPPLLSLHSQELQTLASSSSRLDAARRLLRLLMLSPRRRLPLPLLHRLRFDLGLPRDFPLSLLPDFPDFFRLSPSPTAADQLDLDLVCYSKDLAVSDLEGYAIRTGGYTRGTPLSFPMSFPRGFEMEKKVRKWVEEWQRLPYVSPYEDGSRLRAKSDVWEKWVVGMVHEVLSLMVGKKLEKDKLVAVGEHLGLPSRVRKMVLNYPGVFYLSSKLGTQTVVLREAYRRDLLVEKHPLMGLRYQYIHLMHKGREGETGDAKKRKSKRKKNEGRREGDVYGDEGEVDGDGNEEEEEDDDENEENDEISDVDETDDEEDESDDDDEDYGTTQKNVGQKGYGGGELERVGPRMYTRREGRGDRKQTRGAGMKRNGGNRGRSMGGRSNGKGNAIRGERRSTPRSSVPS